jgi:hypothetical protein
VFDFTLISDNPDHPNLKLLTVTEYEGNSSTQATYQEKHICSLEICFDDPKDKTKQTIRVWYAYSIPFKRATPQHQWKQVCEPLAYQLSRRLKSELWVAARNAWSNRIFGTAGDVPSIVRHIEDRPSDASPMVPQSTELVQ